MSPSGLFQRLEWSRTINWPQVVVWSGLCGAGREGTGASNQTACVIGQDDSHFVFFISLQTSFSLLPYPSVSSLPVPVSFLFLISLFSSLCPISLLVSFLLPPPLFFLNGSFPFRLFCSSLPVRCQTLHFPSHLCLVLSNRINGQLYGMSRTNQTKTNRLPV